RHSDPVRLDLLPNQRQSPMLRPPSLADLVDPRTRFLAPADHEEHCLERLVAAFADPTRPDLFERHQERARIRQLDAIPVLLDHDSALAAIVGMNQRVYKGFPDRLMDEGLILAEEILPESEGELHVGGEPLDDSLIELEKIGDPGAVD